MTSDVSTTTDPLKTIVTSTTTHQEGFGGLFNEIIDDIEDGVEAIGDALHSFIDDNFD